MVRSGKGMDHTSKNIREMKLSFILLSSDEFRNLGLTMFPQDNRGTPVRRNAHHKISKGIIPPRNLHQAPKVHPLSQAKELRESPARLSKRSRSTTEELLHDRAGGAQVFRPIEHVSRGSSTNEVEGEDVPFMRRKEWPPRGGP